MNVLVIGGGGREHALCWAIAKSPRTAQLFCAPGNAGIASVATCVDLSADAPAVIEFCQDNSVDLVVIGPEGPLVAGLADDLTAVGIRAFGPSAAAAELEGSKGFTKELCREANIPTAAFERFDDADAARDYVRKSGAPIVIKADGLAAGKGVIIAETVEEAERAVAECLAGKFGKAGRSIVVEEFLTGEEASYFALVDGEHILPLATAQDHKAVGDGDVGPNTGGMGAYSPAPVMTDDMCRRVLTEIIQPTVKALQSRGIEYKGVLYAGLMITDSGPKLIEYNCRFGDPECQVLMARLDSDLVTAMLATVEGNLDQISLSWKDQAALTVVMAARGYPGSYEKGSEIGGLDQAGANDGVTIFHAGTGRQGGTIVAKGGRVLNVTAIGKNVREAQERAYLAVDQIRWPEGFCRRDIGWRAVERDRQSADPVTA